MLIRSCMPSRWMTKLKYFACIVGVLLIIYVTRSIIPKKVIHRTDKNVVKNVQQEITDVHHSKVDDTQPRIPHRIHQIWQSHQIPELFVPWIKSWMQNHPTWEYWLWTTEDATRLLQKINSKFIDKYNDYHEEVFKANALRYYVMYYFGGVYADLDLESLKPMDPLTMNHYCIMSEETYEHPYLVNGLDRAPLMITMLACRARHKYYELLINSLPAYTFLSQKQKLSYADTIYLRYNSSLSNQQTIREKDKISVFTPEYFLPTFDSGWLWKLEFTCKHSNYINLDTRQKSLCDKLVHDRYVNQPTSRAYTDHKWVHVSNKPDTLNGMKRVSIRDIIPEKNYVNVTEQINKLTNL